MDQTWVLHVWVFSRISGCSPQTCLFRSVGDSKWCVCVSCDGLVNPPGFIPHHHPLCAWVGESCDTIWIQTGQEDESKRSGINIFSTDVWSDLLWPHEYSFSYILSISCFIPLYTHITKIEHWHQVYWSHKACEGVCRCVYRNFRNADGMKCSQGSNVFYLMSVKNFTPGYFTFYYPWMIRNAGLTWSGAGLTSQSLNLRPDTLWLLYCLVMVEDFRRSSHLWGHWEFTSSYIRRRNFYSAFALGFHTDFLQAESQDGQEHRREIFTLLAYMSFICSFQISQEHWHPQPSWHSP